MTKKSFIELTGSNPGQEKTAKYAGEQKKGQFKFHQSETVNNDEQYNGNDGADHKYTGECTAQRGTLEVLIEQRHGRTANRRSSGH